MSSPLPSKRRRLNDSLSTLSKPFVSPLRTSRTSKPERVPLQQNHNAANLLYQPSVLAHTIQAIPSFPTTSTISKPTSFTPAKSTPARKQPPFSTSAKRTDPAEHAAQKALTALELQIRAVRNEIDTLTQATQLTTSTTDTDLEDLAQKWKLAAQTAAEELFGTVKERVCRMGGVAAWRESEKKKYEKSNGWGEFKEEVESDDADCEFDSQGEELPEEEQEYRKKEKRRARREMEEAADVEEKVVEREEGTKKVWQEEGLDDDTFTMDMMLRSLNIELDVIGYDKAAQRWIT